MSRARVSVLLLVLPALALGVLCLGIVATAADARGRRARAGRRPVTSRCASWSASRSASRSGCVAARAGAERILRAAPVLFVVALVATAAVFVPGVGVRAAGASRWLKLGPFSGSPAPFLIGATGAAGGRVERPGRRDTPTRSRRGPPRWRWR